MSYSNVAGNVQRGIFNPRTYLDDRMANITVSPQKSGGLSGWLFDIESNQTLRLQADITDHYTESNSFINDHIVRKPIEITLTGFIGELVFKNPGKSVNIPINNAQVNGALSRLDGFVGKYKPDMMKKIEKRLEEETSKYLTLAGTIESTTKNIIKNLDGAYAEASRQEKAYGELKALFDQNELVTVQTPWAFFANMIIREISFSQSEESASLSDISITLKEMRFADLQIVDFNKDLIPAAIPRNDIQNSKTVDAGRKNPGIKRSLLKKTVRAVQGLDPDGK